MSSSLINKPTAPVFLLKAGGNPQPVPKNDFLIVIIYPPMITVGQPMIIIPPCAVESPIRAAGIPPMSTVADPLMMLSGGPVHTHISPIRAAGNPPIKTVTEPGGNTGPPTCGTVPVTIGQTCMSLTLAANDIVC